MTFWGCACQWEAERRPQHDAAGIQDYLSEQLLTTQRQEVSCQRTIPKSLILLRGFGGSALSNE